MEILIGGRRSWDSLQLARTCSFQGSPGRRGSPGLAWLVWHLDPATAARHSGAGNHASLVPNPTTSRAPRAVHATARRGQVRQGHRNLTGLDTPAESRRPKCFLQSRYGELSQLCRLQATCANVRLPRFHACAAPTLRRNDRDYLSKRNAEKLSRAAAVGLLACRLLLPRELSTSRPVDQMLGIIRVDDVHPTQYVAGLTTTLSLSRRPETTRAESHCVCSLASPMMR